MRGSAAGSSHRGTRSRSATGSETHPSVAYPGCTTCRKMALPLPGTTGDRL